MTSSVAAPPLPLPDVGAALRAARAAGAAEPRPGAPVRTVPAPDRAGPLRIRVLLPRTDVGGGTRVLVEHADRLLDRGHDVEVLAHSAAPAWSGLRAPFRQVPAGTDLADAAGACDLVVAGYWDQVSSAAASQVAPVVHLEQGDFHLFEEVDPTLRERIAREMAAADLTLTVSGAVREILAGRYGVAAEVVPNAVDPAVFRPGPGRTGRRHVLVVGWDGNAFKGMAEARQVARRLAVSHPDVDLVWVTPRPPLEPFGHVVVAPEQPRLAELYRGASAYLCASRYESFPLPPLEAMASGAPVVTTANPGVLEYAVHGRDALVVPVGDPEGMHRALVRVLDDAGLAAALRAGGAATARSHDWATVSSRFEAACRRAAAPRPVGSAGRWTALLGRDVHPVCEADAAEVEHVLARSGAAEVLVPVQRPLLAGHDLVRWEVAARSRDGGRGVVRVHARHVSDRPPHDLDHQDGVDLLERGQAGRAVKHYLQAYREASDPRSRAALGRWVGLALFEADRSDDALRVLRDGMAAHPDHVDYVYLASLVAASLRQPVDLAHALAVIAVVGEGVRYPEWFARPGDLLLERLA